jgi:alkylation response protein AidB-like acyl-CoA dehydrogenase
LTDDTGARQVASFVFAREEVTLRRTWNSMGLAATGSHAFEVRQLAVPARRRFHLGARHATLPDPVYQYPFLPLAEATLAVNLSGMAARFLELAADLVHDQGGAPLAAAHGRLAAARGALFVAVGESWRALRGQGAVPASDLVRVGGSSRQLAVVVREVVAAIYPLCGLRAVDLGSEINRVWRNIHTAGQHALLRAAAD